MANLPITRVTLYKHGVGFFERRAEIAGEEVELSFRVEEMNDILKSLTAIDWGGGQVLGVDYATPQSREERLAGNSIRLSDERSLGDLLVGLRGRNVRLLLHGEDTLEGTLLGIDEQPERQPLETALVSVLLDGSDRVEVVDLQRLRGVELLDETAAADLRFFLETSLSQENYRQVTVRLTPGEHDLSVSYLAPAPTWRVSYRLVAEPDAGGGPKALLLGWGIFDNRLDENLKKISLVLVAGMPISFVYDLYTPFTPERPVIEEEARVAAGPVEFEESFAMDAVAESVAPGAMMRSALAGAAPPPPSPAAPTRSRAGREEMAAAQTVEAQGKELGELFQYVIETPVTVGRGRSAMVPIVSSDLSYRKELLYNGTKLPEHPVATLRMKNTTGLTLERGPVTVLEEGTYVGEAVLPFTTTGGEFVVPYAVELSVKVSESSRSSRESYKLAIKKGYLHFEEWQIRRYKYEISNMAAKPFTILVEHPRLTGYELFDSPPVKERTDAYYRFEITVPAHDTATLQVNVRQLVSRREELQRQSHVALRRYLDRGLMDRRTHDRLVKILTLYESLDDYEKQRQEIANEREKIYKAQQQIQGNMGALGTTGKEGALRSRYVDQLEALESQLRGLEKRDAELKRTIEQVKQEIESRLQELAA